jgi:hypothetical protein
MISQQIVNLFHSIHRLFFSMGETARSMSWGGQSILCALFNVRQEQA